MSNPSGGVPAPPWYRRITVPRVPMPRTRLMAPRDVSFVKLQSLRIYGPFDLPDPQTADARLEAFLTSRNGRMLLRRIDRSTASFRALRGDRTANARLVYSRSDAKSMGDLCYELHARPACEFPMDITLTDSYVAFRPQHVWFDGISGSAYIGDIIAAITGTDAVRETDRRAAFLPLITAVFRTGLYRPSMLRHALTSLKEHQPNLPRPAPLPEVPWRVTRCEVIDAREARQFADRLGEGGRRISINEGITVAIIRAVAAEVDPSIDLAVNMSVDSRRYIGTERFVSGNFAPALSIGRLREDGWSGQLVSDRLRGLLDSAAPLGSIVRGAVRDFRPPPFVPDRSNKGPFTPGRQVTISHVKGTPVFEHLPWSSTRVRHLYCSGVFDDGLGLNIYSERSENVICLAVVDDSNLVNVDSFFERVFAEMGATLTEDWWAHDPR